MRIEEERDGERDEERDGERDGERDEERDEATKIAGWMMVERHEEMRERQEHEVRACVMIEYREQTSQQHHEAPMTHVLAPGS